MTPDELTELLDICLERMIDLRCEWYWKEHEPRTRIQQQHRKLLADMDRVRNAIAECRKQTEHQP